MTMITIPGYRITQQIYSGFRTQVYRGVSEANQQLVAIKLLKSEYPTFNELVQFRNQYTIAKNLDLPGIVKHLSLENYNNSFALVMEAFGGVSLTDYITSLGGGNNSLFLISNSLSEFLNIAIQIAQTLEGLYRHRIIHKDIKPQNILINPQTKQVKLIDFSISSLLPSEFQEIKNPNVLEGTLAYMSPEQTGRMNRGIDYRTDFYSLGVSLYELLTGQLPFHSTDPMELVHCHIARMPTPAIEVNPAIPQILNDIVMKLMAKTAEERYQTAFGIKYDLERCLEQYSEKASIAPFELGVRDIPDRFVIPEKLYGRETEVATLLSAFDRVSAGTTEIVLVAGFSGIGKTAVVNEVHKPIARQRGYFIKGKYDQFQRNIPFSAFVQAFRELMGQLLSESDAQVQTWKTKILTALGDSGQVLIEVLPELERIIGAQPTALELSGSAAQNRFNFLMQKFVQVFTTAEHPLVMFLDDLQWADSASLKLLQLLMEDTGHLLVLGAYRDNEVSPTHPFMLTVDEIVKSRAVVNTITLEPLSLADLNQLVANTLICDLSLAQPLTELVYEKTKGNPFFSTQFLKALYEDGQITFDGNLRHWQCDIAQARLTHASDVVEFMATQLQKLPKETQDVLKLAACIGAQFDLETLAVVSEELSEKTASALWKALQEGLILQITEGYSLIQTDPQSPNQSVTNPIYKFLHDRVQQAAYSLIPNDQKQATHLKIGQLLLESSSKVEIEEKLFDIVGHLNLGIELINQLSEREALAKLNLEAGRKARSSTAYTAANIYLQMGIDILTANCWQSQYELTLNLYVAAAEVAYLNADLDGMEKMAAQVLQKAQTILDKVKIYEIQIAAQTAQSKVLETIAVARDALLQLGIELPTEPDEALIGKALQALVGQLQGRKIEELVNLPVMTNPQTQAAMQLLGMLFPTVFQGMPGLLPLLSSTMVSLSLQFGNASASTVGYAIHGMVLCAFLKEGETGYGFGKLALSLLDRFNVREFKSIILFLFGAWIQHHQEAVRATIPTLKDGFTAGMETGNFLYAGYSISLYFDSNIFGGIELDTLEPELASYSAALAQVKQYSAQVYLDMKQQMVLNLREAEILSDCLIGSAYDETVMIPKHHQNNDLTAIAAVYIYKLFLAYSFGNYTTALDNIAQCQQYLMAVSGLVFVPFFHFYAALTHLALFPAQPAIEPTQILSLVETHQTTLHKWAQNAPMNYLHKWYLVEAECYRVLGNKAEAIEMYDCAISGAKENKYVNDEALANELAAKFYWEWGKTKVAQAYIFEAYYCYVQWGATAKITDLEKRYSQLLSPILNEKVSHHLGKTITQMTTGTLTSTGSRSSEVLDLATVIKASQALSGEIQLNQLLSTFMQVVIENAGATKCVLILEKVGHLVIEVIALGTGETANATQAINLDTKTISIVLPSTPFEESQDIPVSAINYVWRTQETLVLNDVLNQQDNPLLFATDSYLIQQPPKSLLCTPIQTQGKAIGILYLENNLAKDAFTPERLEVLKVLSSQAAISLENVRLYSNLEEYNHTLETKVEERTQELSQALEHLKATQEELVQSEKMAALGQLIAGIAHEINTPLGAIHSSAGNISKFLNQTLEQLPKVFQSLSPEQGENFLDLIQRSLQQEITFSTKEERKLKKALKSQLEASSINDIDRIADTLVTMGIYDEIDVYIPLFKQSDSLHLLEIAYKVTELKRGITTIDTATDRASKVVYALKSYARYDHSGEMARANLIDGIETILTLYQNQLRQGVEVIRNYTDLPPLLCYPDELNQVWTNLIHNALQAMDNQGTLTIDVIQQGQQMKIAITDSGKGISDEIKSKIFEPFFTTKAPGEGSGLGLDIAKKIIAKHSGKITVESQPGQTTFNVFLPICSI